MLHSSSLPFRLMPLASHLSFGKWWDFPHQRCNRKTPRLRERRHVRPAATISGLSVDTGRNYRVALNRLYVR